MNLIGYKKFQKAVLQFALDTVLVTFSFYLAYHLKRTVVLADPQLDSLSYLKLYIIALPFLMGTLYLSRLYTLQVMLFPLRKNIATIVRAVLSMYAVFIVLSFYLKIFSYSRMVFTLFLFMVFPSLLLSRALFNSLGRGSKLPVMSDRLRDEVIFFTDHPKPDMSEELRAQLGCMVEEINVGSKTDQLVTGLDMIRQGDIGAVFIDLDDFRTFEAAAILERAHKEGVTVYVLPRSVNENALTVSVESLGSYNVIVHHPARIPTLGYVQKRVFDLVLTSIVAVFLLPIMLLIACAIKLTSRGPIIYSQPRVGYGGRIYTLYKFRSMATNAEAISGPVWATRDDGRVTKLGRFLRQSNLDELPQFFNVLRGDMSLVGPRPERPEFVADFKEEIEKYSHKHCVRPGITGLAQINGWRGDTSLVERIKCDLFYIENWSLWIDLKILLYTPFKAYKNAM